MTKRIDDPIGLLRWLLEAGNDEAILDQPVNHFRAPNKGEAPVGARPPNNDMKAPQRIDERARTVTKSGDRSAPTSLAAKDDGLGNAFASAERCNTLDDLRRALETFEGSQLKKNASKTVFADGNPRSGILFIGEAPGRDEDRIGLPFVGRAGKLLDLMLLSIGLDRRSAYIINVLPWRPPDNRNPEATEVAQCIPFLRRHIELASPEIMILLGSAPLRHVLGFADGIMKSRGRWADYRIGQRSVPVMPTLHPAYLLRQPAHKRLAWRDFQEVADRIAFLQLRKATEIVS